MKINDLSPSLVMFSRSICVAGSAGPVLGLVCRGNYMKDDAVSGDAGSECNSDPTFMTPMQRPESECNSDPTFMTPMQHSGSECNSDPTFMTPAQPSGSECNSDPTFMNSGPTLVNFDPTHDPTAMNSDPALAVY